MWKAVKDLRKKFVLEFVKMKKGKCRACTLRQKNGNDCLATEHWKNKFQDAHPREDKIVEDNAAATAVFTMSELNDAIKATKANKQPGPDGIIMELLKWFHLEISPYCRLSWILGGLVERRPKSYSWQE